MSSNKIKHKTISAVSKKQSNKNYHRLQQVKQNNTNELKENEFHFNEIPQTYFTYRHVSLYNFLTNFSFQRSLLDNKSNYEKTLSLFKQNKLDTEQDKKNTFAILNPSTNPLQQHIIPRASINNLSRSVNFSSQINNKHNKEDKDNNKKKKFICIGGYKDVINCLKKRGWELNKDPKSSDFDYIWTLKTIDINFANLRKEQLAGHFSKNGAITRKNGLCKNIRNLYYKGIDPNNFFPRCYDLSNKNDYADFMEDFKTNRAVSIIKKVYNELNHNQNENKKSEFSENVIKTALDIVQKKINILTCDFVNIKQSQIQNYMKLITEQEWGIISGEDITKQKTSVLDSLFPNKFINSTKRPESYSNESTFPSFPMRSQSELSKKLQSLNTINTKSINNNNNNIKHIVLNKPKEKHFPLLTQLTQYTPIIKSVIHKLEQKQPQYKLNGCNNIWIVKPGNLSRGRGIHCVSKLSSIIEQCQENNYIIVQKYIENPLIISNRKFDIRQWVLVTNLNPLTIWVWDLPYFRFCAEDYSLNDINNLYSHLTNNSIAKYSKHFNDTKIQGNMWEVENFISHLDEMGKEGSKMWKDIHDKMKKIIICSFESARHEIKQRENSHELFGYDFMIDENYNVILIEVNSSPALDYSTKVTERLVKMMIENLIKVVIDKGRELKQLDKVDNWIKIYEGQDVNAKYKPNPKGL